MGFYFYFSNVIKNKSGILFIDDPFCNLTTPFLKTHFFLSFVCNNNKG